MKDGRRARVSAAATPILAAAWVGLDDTRCFADLATSKKQL
jgi:hypothetical protein